MVDDDPTVYRCPHCDAEVTISAGDAAAAFACPSCGNAFTVPAAPGADARAVDELAATRADELDALRIRQLATAKRSAYRARSYAVIAMVVCQVAAVQLALFAFGAAKALGPGWRFALYAACATASQFAVAYLFRKVVALHREATRTIVPQPTGAPDFTTLSDGSQQWKNLEHVE